MNVSLYIHLGKQFNSVIILWKYRRDDKYKIQIISYLQGHSVMVTFEASKTRLYSYTDWLMFKRMFYYYFFFFFSSLEVASFVCPQLWDLCSARLKVTSNDGSLAAILMWLWEAAGTEFTYSAIFTRNSIITLNIMWGGHI